MMAEPQAEHRWLRQLVGAWRYEVECTMGPGQPMSKSSGTEAVRTLGGLWVVAESRGEMPSGGPATMLLTLGFDPRRGRFVGTWAGSMMTHLWMYDGALDAAGKVLTLDTDDHRVLTGRRLGDDGRWHVLMTARYHRVKG
jgi:hypothetical protein